MDTFWGTIGFYNSMTWGYQVFIVLIGVILTFLLLHVHKSWIRVAMKIYIVCIYLWIALVYYLIYCAERSYTNIMVIFWLVMAAAWIWDLVTGYTTFERHSKYTILGYLLLAMPFLYPVFSLLRGMRFPEMTSPLMPCSVVTFTIGLLLLHARRVNLFILLLLCHWSLIGLTKASFFKIPEDFILVATSLPAIYLFFKEYYLLDFQKETKPKAKYINGLLLVVCALIGVVLVSTLVLELIHAA